MGLGKDPPHLLAQLLIVDAEAVLKKVEKLALLARNIGGRRNLGRTPGVSE